MGGDHPVEKDAPQSSPTREREQLGAAGQSSRTPEARWATKKGGVATQALVWGKFCPFGPLMLLPASPPNGSGLPRVPGTRPVSPLHILLP